MGEQRSRNRIVSKVDLLPEEVKEVVNQMLLDLRYTYNDIAIFLKEEGYEISKSSVGRYAMRSNAVAKRLLEAQEQAKVILDAVKNHPETDYTEGAMQIMAGELTKKMATAQEEWDDMPVEKAAKIMVSLSRTKTYKDKIRAELEDKMCLAMEEFKRQLREELKEHPELLQRLSNIADKMVKETIESDTL